MVTLLILKGFLGVGDCVHGLPVNHSSYDSKYIKNIMKLYIKIESKESDLSGNRKKEKMNTHWILNEMGREESLVVFFQ